MTALLLDEMISPSVAGRLTDLGHDVVAISAEPRWRGASDADVLELAAAQDRVLVTDNVKDFARLDAAWAAQGRTHRGVVFISAKTYPHTRQRVGRIAAALQGRFDEDRWPPPGQCAFL